MKKFYSRDPVVETLALQAKQISKQLSSAATPKSKRQSTTTKSTNYKIKILVQLLILIVNTIKWIINSR